MTTGQDVAGYVAAVDSLGLLGHDAAATRGLLGLGDSATHPASDFDAAGVAATAVAAHVAATDPHPQYTTAGEAAAAAPVQSVAGRAGAVTLAVGDVSGAAPLASPTLTGTPAGPTAAADTNTTQLATTGYVVGQGYLKSATASSTYQPLAANLTTLAGTAPGTAGLGLLAAADYPTARRVLGSPPVTPAVKPTDLPNCRLWIDSSYRTAVVSDATITSTTLTNRGDNGALTIHGSPKLYVLSAGGLVGRPGIGFPTDSDWIDFTAVVADVNNLTNWAGDGEQQGVGGLTIMAMTSGQNDASTQQWLTGWVTGTQQAAFGMTAGNKTQMYEYGVNIPGLQTWAAQADGGKVLWVFRLPRVTVSQWAMTIEGSGYKWERQNSSPTAPLVTRLGGASNTFGAKPNFRLHDLVAWDTWLTYSQTASAAAYLLSSHRDTVFPRLVVLGDSITDVDPPAGGWSYAVQSGLLATYPRLTLSRLAVRGRGIGEWLERWEDEIRPALAAPNTVVHLWAPSNTLALQGYTGAQAAAMHLTLAHLCRGVGARVVIGACLPRSSFLGSGVTQGSFLTQANAFNAAVAAGCTQYGYGFADYMTDFGATYLATLSIDGTHPNTSGVTAIATTASTVIAAKMALALAD